MKDASNEIRTIYYNALQGIEYNSRPVPVYKDPPVSTVPDHFILIGSITETNEANDSLFIRPTEITIEISTQQYKYKNRDVCDSIAQDVMDAILNVVGGSITGLYFQIGHVELSNSLYLDNTNKEYFITRRILTFTQTLIEY